MGTRVTTIVKSTKDKIFWSNSTSFNVEDTVKGFAFQSSDNEELIDNINSFKSTSNIANREEGFSTDIEYPFGDFEYIIYVDSELNVSKISIEEYAKITGKSVDYFYNLKIA